MVAGRFIIAIFSWLFAFLLLLGSYSFARPFSCAVLEKEFRSHLDPQIESDFERLNRFYALYAEDYDRLKLDLQGMGCDRLNPYDPKQISSCSEIESRFLDVQTMLGSIDFERKELLERYASDPAKRSILSRLGQNRCGAHYESYVVVMPSVNWLAGSEKQQQKEEVNLENSPRLGAVQKESYPGNHLPAQGEGYPIGESVESYTTVCVRLCDGYYFPVSFATIPPYFDLDSAQCEKMCPAAFTELYIYRNLGGSIAESASLSGLPYSLHPNAFSYQTFYNPECSCIPPLGSKDPESSSGYQKIESKKDVLPSHAPPLAESQRATVTTAHGQFSIPSEP